jgi:MoaA/NifB/PqqE/SkfB family radical SAM enzyme
MLLDNLFEQITWFKDYGCSVSLTTNGSLMSLSQARSIVTSGLDGITFSMAGATVQTQDELRGKGTHHKLWKGLHNLYKARKQKGCQTPAVAVSYLLTPETFAELPQAIRQSRSLGVTLFACVHLTHPVTQQQQSMCTWNTVLDKEKRKVLRHAHWQAFLGGIRLQFPPFKPDLVPVCDKNPLERCFIAADGTVTPCVFLGRPNAQPVSFGVTDTRFTSLPVKKFGSLRSQSLDEIWQKKEYQEFRQVFLLRKRVYDKEMAKVGIDLDGIQQLERANLRIRKAFIDLPVPYCCSCCSKMEGF